MYPIPAMPQRPPMVTPTYGPPVVTPTYGPPVVTPTYGVPTVTPAYNRPNVPAVPRIPTTQPPVYKEEKFLYSERSKPQRVFELSSNNELDSNPFMNDLLSKRLIEVANVESLAAAANLKQKLNTHQLNIVTAESLTAGMIAKTLVDIPGNGATVYGGYIVYDTDAKRQFIQVDTKGVYSILTAQQMAAGALENSRAMVAVAVSGQAMPFPDEKELLGMVYIGVAIRLSDRIQIYGKEISTCNKKEVKNMCDAWKDMNESGFNVRYAPFQFTSLMADYIRMRTVTEACNETSAVIDAAIAGGYKWGNVHQELYDRTCKASWIISKHMYPPPPSNVPDCEGDDTESLFF